MKIKIVASPYHFLRHILQIVSEEHYIADRHIQMAVLRKVSLMYIYSRSQCICVSRAPFVPHSISYQTFLVPVVNSSA